jgi:hypothetical protein
MNGRSLVALALLVFSSLPVVAQSPTGLSA